MQNMEEIVHNFTDLESFYDRQQENVYRVVEEVIGVDSLAIKLFTKVIPRFEYRICINFGISEASHGGGNDLLGGLGQGMIIPGSSNRDIYFFALKALE